MKQTILIFVALLASSQAFLITPRDIIAEAKKQLEELKATVTGAILVAHSDLTTTQQDFQTYGVNEVTTAAVSIQEERDSIDSQLQTIKDLAHSAGKDISSCTNVREEYLNRLPETYYTEINNEVSTVIGEVSTVLSDARYIVDITINKVDDIEHQLERCGTSITCVSPIVTEIQLNKIRLPQSIKTEVLAAEGLVTTLKVSVSDASEQGVAGYTSTATSVLSDITFCANNIIN